MTVLFIYIYTLFAFVVSVDSAGKSSKIVFFFWFSSKCLAVADESFIHKKKTRERILLLVIPTTHSSHNSWDRRRLYLGESEAVGFGLRLLISGTRTASFTRRSSIFITFASVSSKLRFDSFIKTSMTWGSHSYLSWAPESRLKTTLVDIELKMM